jgi:eukaryotic-like serine/threonine-protein kinase
MGVVYHALHGATGEPAAVKTLGRVSERLLAGFRREVHALARIRHPGVVRILDTGVHEGLPWYAMALLEGPTLGELMRSAAPARSASIRSTSTRAHDRDDESDGENQADAEAVGVEARCRLLRLVRRLCAPLSHLHGEGIVHRDLKPSNVIVTAGDVPVLVDFGVASHFGGPASREVLDLAGERVGTIHYMSPEQAASEFVDARADLYALGCILFEILTGRPPFRGSLRSMLLDAHASTAPVPPSKLADGVPPILDDLVLRLLAKRPSERIGHAEDVAALLDEIDVGDAFVWDAPAPRPYFYRPGLTGRASAVGSFLNSLAKLRRGRGGLVLLAGEGGAGKTRLALELGRRAASENVRVLAGECPQAPTALGALLRPLESMADGCRERGSDETERVFGPRGSVLGLFQPAIARLPGTDRYPPPADLPPADARRRLFAWLFESLQALAADRPVLLLLDDLHRADELTLGFLEYALAEDRIVATPLLVLGTYSVEEAGEALAAATRLPAATVIEVERLDEAAVAALVGDILGMSPPPDALSRFLSGQSEGNPFFVAEYLRAAIEEGLLRRDVAHGWRLAQWEAQGFDRLRLPSSLEQLVSRRLDRLPSPALRAASAAAVLGREASSAVLAAMTGFAEADLDDALGELVRRYVVEETGIGLVRFTHDNVRSQAYERASADERARLHAAAARALAASGREPDAVLAWHWERANEPEPARKHYLAAARSAKRRYAHAEAEQLYESYFALTATPDAETAAAYDELGSEILRPQGRGAEAVARHTRAVDCARRLGDRESECRSLRLLGVAHAESGAFATARALYEEALRRAREAGLRKLEGLILLSIAIDGHSRGNFEEARARYEEALAIAEEAGDQKVGGVVIGNLAQLFSQQGKLDEAADLLEQALVFNREAGDRVAEGNNLLNLANVRATTGRLDDALRLYERALAVQRDAGERRSEGVTLSHIAAVRADQGFRDEARALFDEAAAALAPLGVPQHLALVLLYRATAERRYGAYGEAELLLDEAASLLDEVGDTLSVALCACERGHLALARGEPYERLLKRAGCIAASIDARPESDLGVALARLERAAHEPRGRLLHGEHPDDVPAALR